ncbi:endolytic transglycosylase MltG [Algihabitans albus]|uniref:endolytic transglycosylase MltG n=1 Tax=Algihabitans albus TaxID=2164067 RepID=UPI0035D020BF
MGSLRLALGLVLAGGLTAAGLVAYNGYASFTQPGPLDATRRVVVEAGMGLEGIAERLTEANVISDPLVFRIGAKLTDQATRLKAGEYEFPPGVTMQGVLDQLNTGDTVVRRLTIPEGLTSAEVVTLIEAAEGLVGEVPEIPAQGVLLPETYHYAWGDSRADLVARMRASLQAALDELWIGRAEGLPLETPQQAVVLASIIEKETGVDGERALVSSVFINRLNRGMRLQSDPTVVFALTEGAGPLDRTLTRADWQIEHPYNTYRIDGLPPGPIANPGRAALAAALAPAESDYLYFVADGTGGHAFATSLAEHNRNVARWRRVRDGLTE